MKKLLIACAFVSIPIVASASYTDSTGGVIVVHSDGSYTEYNPASNTDVARGNALLSAKAALVDGDVIYMSAGTFDIGTNNVIDLSIDGTKSSSIHGAGKTSTTIKVTSTDVDEIIGFGLNSNISDFTIDGTMDAGNFAEQGETSNRQSAWGNIGNLAAFQNVFMKNVSSDTGSDGLYVTTGSGNLKIVDSDITTHWDAFIWCSAGRVDVYDSTITIDATNVANSSRGPWQIDECGPIYLWNTSVNASGGINSNRGIENAWGPPNEIYVYGGTIHASGADAVDIYNPSNGFVGVSPSATYTTSSGTVTAISEATKTVPTMSAETWSMTNPTLSTPQTSSIQKTSAQLSSAISSASAVHSVERGFRYSTDGTTWSTTTPELGDFGTDTFTATISGLTCETSYVAQSFSKNAVGWGYSSSKSFTTASCADESSTTRSGSRASRVVQSPVTAPVAENLPGCPVGYQCVRAQVQTMVPQVVDIPVNREVISAVIGARNLKLSSTGPEVLSLQKFLNGHGYVVSTSGPGSIGNESRYFGEKTEAALKRFQADHGLPVTGFFGPMTREKIRVSF